MGMRQHKHLAYEPKSLKRVLFACCDLRGFSALLRLSTSKRKNIHNLSLLEPGDMLY